MFQISTVITLMGDCNDVNAKLKIFSNECTDEGLLRSRVDVPFDCYENVICTATRSFSVFTARETDLILSVNFDCVISECV